MFVILVGVSLFAAGSLFAIFSYGRFAEQARGAPSTALPMEERATILDVVVAELTAMHPEESGIALLSDSLRSFGVRAHSARNSGRSLDLMYYYWKNDLTGYLLAREVVAAADRGVRVRVILDDISTRGDDSVYLALDSHSNIELRLFNPARARAGALRRGLDLLLRALSATRRMHNKAWIADGRLAIVGGRNIGDAYFDASDDTNFRDMDLLLLGPAVSQTETIFDAFWNSAAILPVRALSSRKADLLGFRTNLETVLTGERAEPYLRQLRELGDCTVMLTSARLHWTKSVEILSDPPEKAWGGGSECWLRRKISPVINGASDTLAIISPYFIPGEAGVEQLTNLAKRGIDVTISTNSLAATDVVAVHGAYAPYRNGPMASGVKLFELRREVFKDESVSFFNSGGASLHTKAFTVDDRWGFIGSFNFDPRSVCLNTEMGALFDIPALTQDVKRLLTKQIAPKESYRLFVENGRVAWEDGLGADARIWRSEPKTSAWRRFAATTIGWPPIESQL